MKVDKFIFLLNFIVLDMEKDREVLIILRIPFFHITRALIDVEKRELALRVQDQEITFNIFRALKFTNEDDECFVMSVVSGVTSDIFVENTPRIP